MANVNRAAHFLTTAFCSMRTDTVIRQLSLAGTFNGKKIKSQAKLGTAILKLNGFPVRDKS